MYEDHYGLEGRPFQLTPDPRFWFDTATHRKAMAYLGYGLSQGEGFIVITGDIGAGKTTLVGHLMATVDRERLHVIKIVSTQIEAEDLLRLVADGLSVDTQGMTKSQLLTAIERGLHATARSGRRTLLIVDEAQALPIASLEELRMLSNFQASGHALLQIFLLGQPEFRERLHGSDRLEQLRQRVIAMHHLDPMGREEVEPYMVHRLSVVGWQGNPHFTADAYRAMFDGSDGVPRRLNQLAGRVMLYGAIEQLDTIDGRIVAMVLADIAGDAPGMATPAFDARIDEPVAAIPEEEPVVSDASEDEVPVEDGAPVECELPVTAPVEGTAVVPVIVAAVAEPVVEQAAPAPVETPGPRPIFLSSPPSEPLPIRGLRVVGQEAEPDPEPRPDPEPEVEDEPEEAGLQASVEIDVRDRIAALEARVEEQEVAMRRVLTLMVDWVEGGARGEAASASVAH